MARDNTLPPSDASHPAALREWLARVSQSCGVAVADLEREPAPALHAIYAYSPYLTRLIDKYPLRTRQLLSRTAAENWLELMHGLRKLAVESMDAQEIRAALRHHKAQCALTIAWADIAGAWGLQEVTRALSDQAEVTVERALHYLLMQAVARGELSPANPALPENGCGIIILGMGKLGGWELNYSSDIDLILLYEPELLPYSGNRNAQHFMSKLANDLVSLLEERTSDGYVFRTDLRLRPDPMSTPPAVTVAAALSYYETVGQNWERAAMIKARPIAGDLAASGQFMRDMVPFIWRKTLDFATIADIHSIKRQMNVRGMKEISLAGHNIKTGMGGIREIEFFAQTLQLVWGGRIPELRVRGTLEALSQLRTFELIAPAAQQRLSECYHMLRAIEHRLQMRRDEQTHQLPADAAEMHALSQFCGFKDEPAFADACLSTLHDVHRVYTESMTDSTPLAVDGNLVFTGVEADADTLQTLQRMGYSETQRISDIIQGWHRGHRRSTRSKRSRQVLTELVPALLSALAKTARPDTAFFHFDDFLSRLPSGAQIFSLLLSRPQLLTVLADILGSAPALGDALSNNPSLLDSALEPDFFSSLPVRGELQQRVEDRLRFAPDIEQKMLYLRMFNNEKRFQAGVHLLKRLASPKRIGAFLSDIAEITLQSTMQKVWGEYRRNHPALGDIPFAIVGFGKLGGREMTFGSDLDLVFLFDDSGDAASEIRVHVTRVSQRLINACTLLTREGRLYAVDTRLRPGGSDGPIATSLAAYDAYLESSAWTYELMAATRARVVAATDARFADAISAMLRGHILRRRDPEICLRDMRDMRERIAREHATRNPWDLKHVRGGMVDLDFLAQYLVLRDGHAHPSLLKPDARSVLEAALTAGILSDETAQPLIAAKKFMTDLLSLQRISVSGELPGDDAPEGLKQLLCEGMRVADFATLREQLHQHQAHVTAAFDALQAR